MSRGARIVPVVVAIASLALYVRTLLPGMAFDDWGEMQTVPWVLGIPHPTGYPTYVMAAWLFEHLAAPLGGVAFRANLFSAACIALALATSAVIGMRLGVNPFIAGVAAYATGLVGTIWGSATVAEVNPLHVLLVALILERSLAWAQDRRLRDLALGGLLVGLSLANHPLTVLVAPWAVGFVLWSGWSTIREHPRWILAPAVTGLIGLSAYLYLPIAAWFNPPLIYNNPVTWDAFKFLVTGQQFQGQYDGLLSSSGPQTLINSLPALWEVVVHELAVPVTLLGIAGAVALLRRRPAAGVMLAGVAVTGVYAWANYLHLEHYLLVPFLVAGMLAGVALDGAANLIASFLQPARRRLPAPAIAGAGVVVSAVLLAANVSAQDRSGDHSAETYAQEVFAVLPANAAILSFWGPSSPLWHATLVLGQRPDVLVVDDSNIVYEGWGTREARIQSLICSRPVFILRPSAFELQPTRSNWTLDEVARVRVGYGSPDATTEVPLYRVEPPASCPG
jgi:transmembrane protein TMEM260 (protein O-mannosyltransferase)